MDRRVRERSAEDRRSQGRISAGFQPSTSSSKRPYGELPSLTDSVADPGCLSPTLDTNFFPSCIQIFSILDPNFFHPGSKFFSSRIRSFSIPDPHQRIFKYFNPKSWFLSSRNMIRVSLGGSSSRRWSLEPVLKFDIE